MEATRESNNTRLWAHELADPDSEVLRQQKLWHAVVMLAVRDLLGFETRDLTISAFSWVFCDADFDTVAAWAGLEPDHLRPRLAALVKVNTEAVAEGGPFLYKNGRGVCLRNKPTARQQGHAQDLLQQPMARAVFDRVPAFTEGSETLIRRIHQQVAAPDKKRKEIAA